MKYRRMTALLLMVLTGCTVGGRQEETAPVTTEVMQTELQTEISSEAAPDTTEESSFVHEGDIGYSTDEKYADEGDVTSVPRDTETPYCTYTNFIRGAGDMHSCAADLIAFDRALFAGELLNKSSLDEMFNMDKTYGCGWFIEKAHPEHFMHTGEVGNYLTLSAVYNTKDRGRIYLIERAPNNDHDTLRTLYEIYDALRLGLDK